MLKIYLYGKDPYKAKCQVLINKHEGVGWKHCNYSKTVIEYSNNKEDVYENIEECNLNKNAKYWSCFVISLLMCLVAKNII